MFHRSRAAFGKTGQTDVKRVFLLMDSVYLTTTLPGTKSLAHTTSMWMKTQRRANGFVTTGTQCSKITEIQKCNTTLAKYPTWCQESFFGPVILKAAPVFMLLWCSLACLVDRYFQPHPPYSATARWTDLHPRVLLNERTKTVSQGQYNKWHKSAVLNGPFFMLGVTFACWRKRGAKINSDIFLL